MKSFLVIFFFIMCLGMGLVIDGLKSKNEYLQRKANTDYSMLVLYAKGYYKPPRGYKFFGLGCCDEKEKIFLSFLKGNDEIQVHWTGTFPYETYGEDGQIKKLITQKKVKYIYGETK